MDAPVRVHVSEPTRDPVGTGLSLAAGAFLGAALAAPMLPKDLPGLDIAVGPMGTSIIVASVAVVAIPVCLFSMYLLLAELDR